MAQAWGSEYQIAKLPVKHMVLHSQFVGEVIADLLLRVGKLKLCQSVFEQDSLYWLESNL